MTKKRTPGGNTGYTSCVFQSHLQGHRSLARAVMVDNEVATNTRPLHTLNVTSNPKRRHDRQQ